jgi:formate dehydrogenase subunit beta
MKINTILPVKDGDILETLRSFLGSLLENQVVDALLVPQEIANSRTLFPTLVQNSTYLTRANPLSPVMPVNSAILVSQLTTNKPRWKVGVVLRSCEIRALLELVKLHQANLDNVIIIGIDCLGAYEAEDYARMMDEMEGPAEENEAKVVDELRTRIANESAETSAIPLRIACQICEYPVPDVADITIGLIGVDEGILVTLDNELASKLGLVEGEAPKREEAVARLVETRTAARDQLFTEFRDKTRSITDFADQLATCIGCYACSVACPICFCKECFFRTDTFEPESERYFRWAEQAGALRMPTDTLLYHLTRLNHMVASCVGCGLCQSACPRNLPLTAIFRTVGDGVQKMLDYVPGRNLEEELPLTTFKEEGFAVV